MIKHVGKRGDTLIEVMLAVGIFSMVAVAVVAVMSGGTSSAQTALETTLAREEIDAQAEALRFIHSAYIADKNAGTSSKFGTLWDAIKGKAVVFENDNTEAYKEYKESITQYIPSSCQELYDGENNIFENQNPFVLNTQVLGTFTLSDINDGKVIISGSDKLLQSSTYPRLIFTNLEGDENETLLEDSGYTNLLAAEGIYIIAIKDPNSTTIIGSESADNKEAAYFDFYIRTCWYGTGDQNPSTISTVMRLYDPDAVKKVGN